MMEEELIIQIKNKNFAILDIEYLQSSKIHKCFLKSYILAKDGDTNMELEFKPCKPLNELPKFYQRSFRFCEAHIHKLPYYPSHKYAPRCSKVLEKINAFIVYNSIDCILYKGGVIEQQLCQKLCIPSYNLEYLPNLGKVESHDPQTEVNRYYRQHVNLGYVL